MQFPTFVQQFSTRFRLISRLASVLAKLEAVAKGRICLGSLIFPGVFGEITEWRKCKIATLLIVPNRVRCWQGRISEPAGSWFALSPSSGGSEIRPYHIPCTYALAKHTRNGISQQALASLMLVLVLRLVFILLDCPKNLVLWSVLVVGDWRHVIRQR